MAVAICGTHCTTNTHGIEQESEGGGFDAQECTARLLAKA